MKIYAGSCNTIKINITRENPQFLSMTQTKLSRLAVLDVCLAVLGKTIFFSFARRMPTDTILHVLCSLYRLIRCESIQGRSYPNSQPSSNYVVSSCSTRLTPTNKISRCDHFKLSWRHTSNTLGTITCLELSRSAIDIDLRGL
ncbi:hypothetical protein RRG08_062328 [Elysia crispata]|uniref:Uncharacterized protein n=1 Tax=Elysia crispata TaxID=231223 RepID=A0AAE1CYT7_9GAST|nr:hypothetical protein RRG08_062328 [Elysia crispata]